LEQVSGSSWPNREASLGAIRREYIYLTTIARTLWLLSRIKPDATRSIVDIVESQAQKRPRNIAIYCLDQEISR